LHQRTPAIDANLAYTATVGRETGKTATVGTPPNGLEAFACNQALWQTHNALENAFLA